jgi:hypothetical protein
VSLIELTRGSTSPRVRGSATNGSRDWSGWVPREDSSVSDSDVSGAAVLDLGATGPRTGPRTGSLDPSGSRTRDSLRDPLRDSLGSSNSENVLYERVEVELEMDSDESPPSSPQRSGRKRHPTKKYE